jgi:DegT/DnrJ/EryC1/StrS aminotransferase family
MAASTSITTRLTTRDDEALGHARQELIRLAESIAEIALVDVSCEADVVSWTSIAAGHPGSADARWSARDDSFRAVSQCWRATFVEPGDRGRDMAELAIHGGPRVADEPFPAWPSIDAKGIEKAAEVLRSGKVNYWTGSTGHEFEQAFAGYCDARFAISTTNGTAALHTALASLGVGPGDEVICPSYSFIASSFCILQAGAIPVFADVDRTHTLSAADVEAKITPRTRAIVVVHLYGVVADMEPILETARRHDLLLVEDCAQCLGGVYKGRKVGTLGDAGCFSFCQSKHFTTGGEGGAIVTNDEETNWACRSFRDHGYDVRERERLLELEARLAYIHSRIGFNYPDDRDAGSDRTLRARSIRLVEPRAETTQRSTAS